MVPAPAQSHLTLLSSDPRDGARLAQAPSAVVLVFNKPLGATAYLRLNSSNQEGQQITNLKVVGSRITAALPPVGAGRFQLAYRAVSAQGHPLTGAIRLIITCDNNLVT
ncbi:MAG TPA: copper resistance protein CopC, partial [Marmoricola sp.]|nr:copper resistance protein CopC [Marmoricola sp.]